MPWDPGGRFRVQLVPNWSKVGATSGDYAKDSPTERDRRSPAAGLTSSQTSCRVPESPETRSQGHRSIPENPFVVGVWGFRATLYEGEGGALRGALLPVTVFLAVKVTGGSGLASWDRALVGVWLCRGATKPPVFRFPEEAAV